MTIRQACKLLGPHGEQLIRQGAAYDNIDIERDVYLRGDLFRLKLRGAGPRGETIVVTIAMAAATQPAASSIARPAQDLCEHVGAAVSLILEEKTALGLAAPPGEQRRPWRA